MPASVLVKLYSSMFVILKMFSLFFPQPMPNHRPCHCPHIAPYPPYAIRNVIVIGMVTTAIAMS